MFTTTLVLAFFKSLKFEKNDFFGASHPFSQPPSLFLAYLCTFAPFLSLSVCVGATGNSLLVISDNFSLNCRGEATVHKADEKLCFLPLADFPKYWVIVSWGQQSHWVGLNYITSYSSEASSLWLQFDGPRTKKGRYLKSSRLTESLTADHFQSLLLCRSGRTTACSQFYKTTGSFSMPHLLVLSVHELVCLRVKKRGNFQRIHTIKRFIIKSKQSHHLLDPANTFSVV